jgi:hypothetical protein
MVMPIPTAIANIISIETNGVRFMLRQLKSM